MNNFNIKSLFFVRFSVKEQTLFVKRLSFLMNANVPILESLDILRTQTKSKSKLRVFDAVIKDVSNGQFLSTSLKKQDRLFSDFVINLIQVGENSGTLAANLAYIADELKKKHMLKTKVIGALLYPACIAVGTVGVTILLIIYIFPKILPVFTSLHVSLPLSTRVLIALSVFLTTFGVWLLLTLVALSFVFVFARRKWEKLQQSVDSVSLRIPIFRGIICDYNLANFCRTLSTLLLSGMRLSDALVVTAGVTKNIIYRQMCLSLSCTVLQGESLSQNLVHYRRIFPDTTRHLVAIGERTGTLSASLKYLSDIHEAEVDEQTKKLSSSIEPILMIVMGLMVGFIAIAIISPMYEITSKLTPHS